MCRGWGGGGERKQNNNTLPPHAAAQHYAPFTIMNYQEFLMNLHSSSFDFQRPHFTILAGFAISSWSSEVTQQVCHLRHHGFYE